MDRKRLWCVRAGPSGEADPIFMARAKIAIGSNDIEDDAGMLPAARAAFKVLVAQTNQTLSPSSIPAVAGQLFRFVHEMKVGDAVVYPRKVDRTVRLGEVIGSYVFETAGSAEFAHRRAVRWQGRLSRDLFSPGARFELSAVLSFFEIKTHAREILGRFAQPNTSDIVLPSSEAGQALCTESAHDLAEATRIFIARRLQSEFKGVPLEHLVADLFRAMGYRAHTTRASRDDGIDVVAHRDELGIEPPIVKIQVKARDANLGADMVKAFAAMVQDRDIGIVITTGGFTQAATDFAQSKCNLKLMDGVGLVELIQKFYDQLDVKYRRQIPLRQVLVPDLLGPDA
jgi:restriction system protein